DRGRDTAEMRSLRARWRAFAERHPQGPRSDEARVRAVALGVEIARASVEATDVEEARRDALSYLDRDDAVQKERVGALLARPLPPPAALLRGQPAVLEAVEEVEGGSRHHPDPEPVPGGRGQARHDVE